MSKNTIGKFIAELRREKGLTQKELAEKLFVSHKTVSRWETGETLPDISLLPVIAEIFGITTDELLCGEKKKDGKISAENIPEKKKNDSVTKTVTPEKTVKQESVLRGEKELCRMIKFSDSKHILRSGNSLAIAVFGFFFSWIVISVFPGSIREIHSMAIISALLTDLLAVYYLVSHTVGTLLTLDGDGFEDKKQIKEKIGTVRRNILKRTLWFVSFIIFAFVLTVTWLHLGDIVEFLLCSLIFTPLTAIGCAILAAAIWDILKKKNIVE